MRLPGSRGREWAERGLRLLAGAVLVAWLVLRLEDRSSGRAETTGSAGLRASLARWSTVAAPVRVHAALDHPPEGAERDWLVALSGAGTAVGWSGPTLLPTAMSLEAVADPVRGVDVAVAAPAGRLVRLRDTLGLRDSANSASGIVRFHLPSPGPAVEAVVGSVIARGSPRDSLQLRRLLVLGQAGWEAKFTIAALEERGWQVEARLAVAPGADITQGASAAIDTGRYSAVVALDSTAVREARRIARYVRSGGGLVLWASASTGGLGELAPGTPGKPIVNEGAAPAGSSPRAALGLTPLTRLSADAVALERQGDGISVAARRVGAGRVVEVGYLDLWRWRMEGGDGAVEAHRAWLARLVAGVAHAGVSSLAAPAADVAPLATLVQQLGPPTPEPITGSSGSPERWARWIFGLICLCLLGEWSSRRLRGLR